MRTPRVSAHPDFGQIGPLYSQIGPFVSDLAKIVDPYFVGGEVEPYSSVVKGSARKSRILVLVMSVAAIPFSTPSPLYAVAGQYSFTTANASGVNGPTQESVTAAYQGTNLAGQVVVRTRGIQEWVVPATDTYTVTAAGASGGSVPLKAGGKGRIISTQIRLIQGQTLKILVGQEGGRAGFITGYAGGGGGGSFIVDSATASPLLVVGGGGGATQSSNSYANSAGSNGLDAAAYNVTSGVAGTGGGAGGTAGNGGASYPSWCGGGGGGFLGNGSDSPYGIAYGGKSFTNGAVAGAAYVPSNYLNIPGGFGGGGGALAMTSYETNGGGGGGYSGGGCGRNATALGGGGGGGNFYTGIYISNSLNTGNGYVTFTRTNLTSAQISVAGISSTSNRTITVLTATSNAPGSVTFLWNGKRIAGCISKKNQLSGSSYVAICNWKPSVRGSAVISASITPSDLYGPGISQSTTIGVAGRTGNR